MENFKDIYNWKIFNWFEQKFWVSISSKPKCETGIGWNKWIANNKEKYPIRYCIFEELPIIWNDKFKWINDLYWGLQYRFNPKHQYHKVTFARPGYYDPDYQILFAVCELVSNFVESQESGQGHVDWAATKEHQKAFNIMKEIRDYWKIEYPNRESEFPPFPKGLKKMTNLFYNRRDLSEQDWVNYEFWVNNHNRIDQKHIDRENEILTKMISIRKFMWD
jgi:hypothetical protein